MASAIAFRRAARSPGSSCIEPTAEDAPRPKTRVTFGSTGQLTPEQARRTAADTLAQVRLGADPAAQKREARKALTFAELADCFLADHVEAKRKPGTARHYRDLLQRFAVPPLGNKKAADVHRSDFTKLHLNLKGRHFRRTASSP